MGSGNMKRTKRLALFVSCFALVLTGCSVKIPEPARQAAIDAVCGDGCTTYKVTHIEEVPVIGVGGYEPTEKSWCLEIKFDRPNGTDGKAAVWVMGPMFEGKYEVDRESPIYNADCDFYKNQ
jgi:hypothetical protein